MAKLKSLSTNIRWPTDHNNVLQQYTIHGVKWKERRLPCFVSYYSNKQIKFAVTIFKVIVAIIIMMMMMMMMIVMIDLKVP